MHTPQPTTLTKLRKQLSKWPAHRVAVISGVSVRQIYRINAGQSDVKTATADTLFLAIKHLKEQSK